MLLLTKDQVYFHHGQHIYTNQNIPKPPPGHEIFCGNLPRDMLEIELFPYFSLIGEIYEFRLMMEFSGYSRGYCFVTYAKMEDAQNAVSSLHGYLIKNRVVYVCKSMDNNKLYMQGIPTSISADQIKIDLEKKFPGVMSVFCKTDWPNRNRKWAFLVFDSHRSAMLCRKKIWPNKLKMWGETISVEWAKPLRSCDTREECTLIVSNLPEEYNQSDVLHFMHKYIKTYVIIKVDKNIGCCSAKLELSNQHATGIAMNILNGIILNGQTISVKAYCPIKFIEEEINKMGTTSKQAIDEN